VNEPLRLRIHVSEPFDFERHAGTTDLFGTTQDHADRENDEWLVELEEWVRFNDADYDQMLIGPRYVGEHLSRVHDALLGLPVRIAHRVPDGWHYAMTGMISLAPLPPAPGDTDLDNGELDD
jgi:hypothetical protein